MQEELDLKSFKEEADSRLAHNKEIAKKLRKVKPRALDGLFHAAHDQVFEAMDCLTCANCCKTTSPIFKQGDIQRMAKAFKMKVPEFIDAYLHLDSEGDYVLNEAPCPFLAADNTCIAYESRPTACREYPHTDRKKMRQIVNLTVRNTLVCPAVLSVFKIIEEKI
ncbi:YkgJ family cysteine cluster protein [Persicobacter sp. CCB-QB2]|uniref:YkgJ family cysteine cluster protein n=1 Tax=Persicobacter sp. CCB-QB2 TaxID=1561025 RepID=UPI0006A97911|nr:YkgJ family cysteine cluster protein [Persicobacter sp. CCB-QB2]